MCTEVLIHQVHVMTYVVKFFSGPRDFKVGSFKPVFQVEFKNRVYSGDQAFIFELYPIFYGQFSQKLQKTGPSHLFPGDIRSPDIRSRTYDP